MVAGPPTVPLQCSNPDEIAGPNPPGDSRRIAFAIDLSDFQLPDKRQDICANRNG